MEMGHRLTPVACSTSGARVLSVLVGFGTAGAPPSAGQRLTTPRYPFPEGVLVNSNLPSEVGDGDDLLAGQLVGARDRDAEHLRDFRDGEQ